MYQLAKNNCPELSQKTSKWILQCQQEAGFGLWPKSSPRLISTYQALTILKDSNQMSAINQTEHTAWIQSCQRPDGSFKSPWSKRNAWEDTFYAAQSLTLLGASLSAESVEHCSTYCQQTLSEGIAKNRIDMSYFSLAALDALGNLDEDTLRKSSKWLQETLEKLLLTNIGLNYENVHHAVMTYHILNQITSQTSMAPQIELLTERIQSALDAELADIRCK
jgi:prenyltransferase beta subunit